MHPCLLYYCFLRPSHSKKLQSDIDLGVNSPNYYACAFKNEKDQANKIGKLKNQKPGLRDNGGKKIINIGP